MTYSQRRLADGSFLSGRLEAKAFDIYDRVTKRFSHRQESVRTWVDPGNKTGTAGNRYSQARDSMTATTKG